MLPVEDRLRDVVLNGLDVGIAQRFPAVVRPRCPPLLHARLSCSPSLQMRPSARLDGFQRGRPGQFLRRVHWRLRGRSRSLQSHHQGNGLIARSRTRARTGGTDAVAGMTWRTRHAAKPRLQQGILSTGPLVLVLRQERNEQSARVFRGVVAGTFGGPRRREGRGCVTVAYQRLQVLGIRVVERVGPMEREVQHDPRSPDVDLWTALVHPHLRRTVISCATDELFERHLVSARSLKGSLWLVDADGEPEVDELDVPNTRLRWTKLEQKILGLHVAMYDLALVEMQ
mmetsp:Transcript_29711/g.81351  ORF Transcript_29711/g.81351 Transcript_29711/m.81351 type:complete len:285 (+) Transcript_29711:268-1122(+)